MNKYEEEKKKTYEFFDSKTGIAFTPNTISSSSERTPVT